MWETKTSHYIENSKRFEGFSKVSLTCGKVRVEAFSHEMSCCSVVVYRYFTLFMNLLNDCSEVEDEGQAVGGRKRGMSRRLASLRHCTVLAMSNLLNANVDSGLMHSIGKAAE